MTQDNTEASGIEPVAWIHDDGTLFNSVRREYQNHTCHALVRQFDAAAIIAQQSEVIALSEDSRLMDEYLKLQRDHERQAETIEKLRADNDRLSGACRDKDAAAEAGKEKS